MTADTTHAHHHDHHHATVDALNEPTRTLTTRRAYARSLRAVLDAIRAAIRRGVVDDDAFGLEALFTPQPATGFDFPRLADKERAFDTWLDNQLSRGILQPNRTGNEFLHRSYTQGLSSATRDLNRVGWIEAGQAPPVEAVIRRGVHRDVLDTVYTRNYRQLRGFSAQMGQETSRVLSNGLAAGHGPREIGRDLAGVIGSGGPSGATGAQARATMIARTETMNSYQRATETRYDEVGVEQVEVLLGGGPCAACEQLAAGGPYRLEEMLGVLPYHPNCVCAVAPVPPRGTRPTGR